RPWTATIGQPKMRTHAIGTTALCRAATASHHSAPIEANATVRARPRVCTACALTAAPAKKKPANQSSLEMVMITSIDIGQRHTSATDTAAQVTEVSEPTSNIAETMIIAVNRSRTY